MSLKRELSKGNLILMEGALGERLKREFGLVFDEQVAMAALVKTQDGRSALESIWKSYIEIAQAYHLPFLATTPTRRANQERMALSTYDETLIQENVAFLKQLKEETQATHMYIGGLMGCKGDAYRADVVLSIEEARAFHSWQCRTQNFRISLVS